MRAAVRLTRLAWCRSDQHSSDDITDQGTTLDETADERSAAAEIFYLVRHANNDPFVVPPASQQGSFVTSGSWVATRRTGNTMTDDGTRLSDPIMAAIHEDAVVATANPPA